MCSDISRSVSARGSLRVSSRYRWQRHGHNCFVVRQALIDPREKLGEAQKIYSCGVCAYNFLSKNNFPVRSLIAMVLLLVEGFTACATRCLCYIVLAEMPIQSKKPIVVIHTSCSIVQSGLLAAILRPAASINFVPHCTGKYILTAAR